MNIDDLQKEISQSELSDNAKKDLTVLVNKAQEQEDGLLSEFNHYVESFEESHPKVTALLNKISNFLSNAGI